MCRCCCSSSSGMGCSPSCCPQCKEAIKLGDWLFISQRGFRFAWPAEHVSLDCSRTGPCRSGIALALVWRAWCKRTQAATGRQLPAGWGMVALIAGLPLLVWAVLGAPTTMEIPELSGFDYQGGKVLSPEFAALLIGLTTYTAAFIAEVVRAGINSVDRGQGEAAMALGLSPGQRLRLITLPQALRVIIPPMTSQYLNLTKNSSLAVAIGYPDLVCGVPTPR